MLTLIHGNDKVASRKVLEELRLKYSSYENIVFGGEKMTLTDMVMSADSMSFLAPQKLVIIENLLTGSVNREKEAILDFLRDKKISAEVILWEGKELPKTIINKYFSDATVVSCPLPAILFRFLDSIGEKPLPTILSMLHMLAVEREAEFILSMLIRQWRNLLIASDLGKSGFAAIPSWQAGKFINQARYFSLKSLISSYRQLLSFDIKIKTGLTPYSLRELLDIFFVSLYYKN